MIKSSEVKKAGKLHGADLVGIASMDRFEGAPRDMDPRYIFPDARAMIVCACRIPRGTLIGIEEGTFFTSYSMMGYAGINFVRMPMVLWSLTGFLEDAGYDAVPIANNFPWAGSSAINGGERKDWSRPVAPGKPAPDVFLAAAEQLCAAPERCLVMEDSRYGVEAAKAAQMRCVAVPYDLRPPLHPSFQAADFLYEKGPAHFSGEQVLAWMQKDA